MPTKKTEKPRNKAASNVELSKEITDKFVSALTWREPFKNKWDRYYKMYRGVLDERNYPWQSNLFIPLSFSTVETIVPRLVSNRPQIDIMPREPGDEDHADKMSALIDYQWDLMNMNVILPEAIKEMAIYGTTVLKVAWKKDERKVVEKELADEDFPELGTVESEQKKVVYDGPCVEVVDLYDFFIDPKATNIDNAQWVIHRTLRPIEHIKELKKQGIYKNVDLLEGTSFSAQQDDDKSDRRSTLGVSIAPETADQNMVELLEYWTDERVVVVANRSVVIRDEKNPFQHGKKPFVHIVDQKVPHEFYGIGELEPIESLQYELNDKRNQRMDNVTLILNRMWKVKNGAGVDEDELISDAGGVVHVNEMEGLDVLPMPDVTASSYQEETLIKGDIQQTSGVTDFTRGVASDALANDTATGISLLQEAGNARFRLKIQNIEDMGIKRLGEFMVAMNEQFISEDQVLRITGDDGMSFEKVTADEIRGNFDVSVVAGSTLPANESIEKKQIMEAYNLWVGDPDVDQRELKKSAIKAIFPKANLEKLLPSKEPQGEVALDAASDPMAVPEAQDQEGMLQSMMSGAIPPNAGGA